MHDIDETISDEYSSDVTIPTQVPDAVNAAIVCGFLHESRSWRHRMVFEVIAEAHGGRRHNKAARIAHDDSREDLWPDGPLPRQKHVYAAAPNE